MVLNSIPIAIYLGWAEKEDKPFWILWVGSTVTSIVGFVGEWALNDKFKGTGFSWRIGFMLVFEVFICAGLLAMMLLVDFG